MVSISIENLANTQERLPAYLISGVFSQKEPSSLRCDYIGHFESKFAQTLSMKAKAYLMGSIG